MICEKTQAIEIEGGQRTPFLSVKMPDWLSGGDLFLLSNTYEFIYVKSKYDGEIVPLVRRDQSKYDLM